MVTLIPSLSFLQIHMPLPALLQIHMSLPALLQIHVRFYSLIVTVGIYVFVYTYLFL